MAMESVNGSAAGVFETDRLHGGPPASQRSSRSDADVARPVTVAFFVLGGVGNLGNDASLEAMIAAVRRHRPEARMMCICGDPEAIAGRFGIAAVPIESRISAGPVYRLFNKLSLRQLGHARNWYETWRALKGVDVLLIPGTGVLDDFGVKAFGFPYRLLMWCAAAKARGAKLGFVSTGAGPITHALSRFFMLTAAKLADWRSYRDEVSRAFMAQNGVRDGAQTVYPDLVFGLPLASCDPNGPPCEAGAPSTAKVIGVGCMNYFGWANDRNAGRGIHDRYIGKLARLVGELGQRGHRVRLLVGDEDQPTIAEVTSALKAAGVEADSSRFDICVAKTLSEHAAQIAQTDIVVGTRYHTVVAALALARPTVSLGYANKFDAVMGDFGLQRYCDHAERFDVDRVVEHVEEMGRDYTRLRQQLAEQVSAERRRLDRQEEMLLKLLPGAVA